MSMLRRLTGPGTVRALALAAVAVAAAGATAAGVCSFVIINGIIETPDPMEHGPLGCHLPWAEAGLDGSIDVDLIFPAPDRALAVWSESTGDDRDIKFAEWVNGKWMPTVVLASSPSDEVEPAIAMASSGAVHVVWAEAEEPRAIVGVSRLGASGQWGRARVLATGGQQPAIVVSGSRRVIAFERNRPGAGWQIVAAVETPSGGFPEAVVAESSASLTRSIGLGSVAGRLWLQWQHTDDRWAVAEYAGEELWQAPKTRPWDGQPWPADAVVGTSE